MPAANVAKWGPQLRQPYPAPNLRNGGSIAERRPGGRSGNSVKAVQFPGLNASSAIYEDKTHTGIVWFGSASPV